MAIQIINGKAVVVGNEEEEKKKKQATPSAQPTSQPQQQPQQKEGGFKNFFAQVLSSFVPSAPFERKPLPKDASFAQKLLEIPKSTGQFAFEAAKTVPDIVKYPVGKIGATFMETTTGKPEQLFGVPGFLSGQKQLEMLARESGLDPKTAAVTSTLVETGVDILSILGAKAMIPKGTPRIAPSNVSYALELSRTMPKKGRRFTAASSNVDDLKLSEFDEGLATRDVVQQAKEKIATGENDPIVVAPDGTVLDGTHRVIAAKEMGIKKLDSVIQEEGTLPEAKVNPLDAELERNFTKLQGNTLYNKLTRINPWAAQSARVESLGPAGQQMVTHGRRAFARQVQKRAEYAKANEASGIEKLTPEELKNFFLSREDKAPIMNENVQRAREVFDPLFRKAAQETDVDTIDNYAPRILNEAGKEYYSKNQSLISMIKEKQNVSTEEAVDMLKGGKARGFFEYERLLDEVPEQYRDFSIETIYRWENAVARRGSWIQEFGKNDQLYNSLLDEAIGKGSHQEQVARADIVKQYADTLRGKSTFYTELGPVWNFLRNGMVIGKLSPLTTMANETQAFINAYLRDGIRGLAGTIKPGGMRLSKELGLESFRGKYGEHLTPDGIASKWMKFIGMNASEARGTARAARAIQDVIDNAWKRVQQNPKDPKALKTFHDLGMFPTRESLDRALKAGELHPGERAIGIIEGTRQVMFLPTAAERPAWAASGMGSVPYIFHHYLLSQLKLLKNAPLHRQIAYVGAIAPLTGLPILLLRRVIDGREMPKNLLDWFIQSSTYGAATPVDITRTLGSESNALDFIAGGFSPPLDVAMNLAQGNFGGATKAAVRGAPIPFGSSFVTPRLFPSK